MVSLSNDVDCKKQNKVQYHGFFLTISRTFLKVPDWRQFWKKSPFVFKYFCLSLRFTMTTVWKILLFFKWFILLWFPIELLWSFFYMSTFYKQSRLWRRFLCRNRIHRSLHYPYARFYVNHFTCISAQINLEPNWNMDLRTLKSKWK